MSSPPNPLYRTGAQDISGSMRRTKLDLTTEDTFRSPVVTGGSRMWWFCEQSLEADNLHSDPISAKDEQMVLSKLPDLFPPCFLHLQNGNNKVGSQQGWYTEKVNQQDT